MWDDFRPTARTSREYDFSPLKPPGGSTRDKAKRLDSLKWRVRIVRWPHTSCAACLLIIPTMIGIMADQFSGRCSSPRADRSNASSPSFTGTDVSATVAHHRRHRRRLRRHQRPGLPNRPATRVLVEIPRRPGARSGIHQENWRQQFGFDKPAYQRFGLMLWNYLRFDFGESYFRDISASCELILREAAGVDLARSVDDADLLRGVDPARHPPRPCATVRKFDTWTSAVIVIVGYAIPGFLFAVLLIILFAGGSVFRPGSRCAVCGRSNYVQYALLAMGDRSARPGRLFLASGVAVDGDGAVRRSPRRRCSPRTRSSTRSASNTS